MRSIQQQWPWVTFKVVWPILHASMAYSVCYDIWSVMFLTFITESKEYSVSQHLWYPYQLFQALEIRYLLTTQYEISETVQEWFSVVMLQYWNTWSRRLFRVGWTTATDCFTASPRVWWAGCNCPECGCTSGVDVTTTSRQCYRTCTGFRFDVGWIYVGWISGWPLWSTCHCPAWLQPI